MPTYDYECQACGHKFEKFHSITAKPIRKCPSCAKLKVKRLIGMGAGIIFKGSGFYQTDYRSSSYREAAKKDKSASESKSADTTPAKAAEGSLAKASGKSSDNSTKSSSKKDSASSSAKSK